FLFLGGFFGYFYGSLPLSNVISPNEFAKEEPVGSEKILDSSVIIDGRILKIAKTNFIEGPFIIPNFVLREIQLISDSADPIKRNRGRRGLDMLNELQQLNNIKVKISYIDYPDIRDVDSKLIQLARDIGGKLITNDFNLEKVAEVQGVQVLNLNALTEALRPIVLPGEELRIQVVKEGKDENQGIGYLDDGTMVVIEDGRELIGKVVKVSVTSIIQTAAGKMIFTKAIGPVSEEELQQQNLKLDQDLKNKKPKDNILKRTKR
ncbi:MAG: PIN/TRAM domain-containing protein, partial [Leptonema sp. (in: bacteria)]